MKKTILTLIIMFVIYFVLYDIMDENGRYTLFILFMLNVPFVICYFFGKYDKIRWNNINILND